MVRPKKFEEKGNILSRFSFFLYDETIPIEINGKTVHVEGKTVLERLMELGKRDAFTQKADLFRIALAEYVTRHSPGNPQLPLSHWQIDEPFSEAAKEVLAEKHETIRGLQPRVTLQEHFQNMTDKTLLTKYEDRETSSIDRQLLVTEIKRRGLKRREKRD